MQEILSSMQWYILIIISAILISFSEIIKKKILRYEHSTEFSTTYSLVITLLMVPFISYLDLNLPSFIITLLFVKSILLLVSSLLFMKAMKHNELSQIIPLKNLSPIFLMILAFFLLNEHITTTKTLGAVIIMASAYLLEKETLKKENMFKNKYFIYVLLSMIFVSFAAVIDKFIIKFTNIYTAIFIPFLLMSIYLLIIQFTVYNGFKDIIHSLKFGKYWILISAVTILLSDYTYFSSVAIQGTLISLIIPLRRVSTLFSTILGGALYHEKFFVDRVAVCIFMLMGVYLLVIA